MGVAAQKGKGEERLRICFHNNLVILGGGNGECLGSDYLYTTKGMVPYGTFPVVFFLIVCLINGFV